MTQPNTTKTCLYNLYEVSRCGDRRRCIEAKSGEQAKRIYCRQCGLTASDYWTGVRSLTARKLKPAELEACREEEKLERDTCVFVKGMLDIYVRAHEDFRGAAME